MAAKTNIATAKVNRPTANNVEITFEDTDTNVEALIGFATEHGWTIRVLDPRNVYGSKGMPTEVKRERLLAELAKLDA